MHSLLLHFLRFPSIAWTTLHTYLHLLSTYLWPFTLPTYLLGKGFLSTVQGFFGELKKVVSPKRSNSICEQLLLELFQRSLCPKDLYVLPNIDTYPTYSLFAVCLSKLFRSSFYLPNLRYLSCLSYIRSVRSPNSFFIFRNSFEDLFVLPIPKIPILPTLPKILIFLLQILFRFDHVSPAMHM